ncbi:MAG TPA: hypothetical protein VN886_02885 [Acidimicrobiales bacterium]|nr:hypothetical protein [Acidimicrobiales bacterium]
MRDDVSLRIVVRDVDGDPRPFTGSDAVVDWNVQYTDDLLMPMSYLELRFACYDPHARLRNMDIDGVYASLVSRR